jgi:hypothetical protein
MHSRLPRQAPVPGEELYLSERAMAPRMRVAFAIVAIIAGYHVWDKFRSNIWRPGFSLHDHLWSNPHAAGYAVGFFGVAIPVVIFMLWWTGLVKDMFQHKKLAYLLTGIALFAVLPLIAAAVYIHDIKLVWASKVQKEGFVQGTLAVLVAVVYFFGLFALITNRLPKPWRNRAYKPSAPRPPRERQPRTRGSRTHQGFDPPRGGNRPQTVYDDPDFDEESGQREPERSSV